jgi:hypothetical protein
MSISKTNPLETIIRAVDDHAGLLVESHVDGTTRPLLGQGPPLLENAAAHISDPLAVDEDAAGIDTACPEVRPLMRRRNTIDLSPFSASSTRCHGETRRRVGQPAGASIEMAVLAVDRDQVLRTRTRLIMSLSSSLKCVAGHVDARGLFIDHVRSRRIQVVDDTW